LAAVQRDHEEARMEYEKEQSRLAAAHAQMEAEQKAAVIQQQQQLAKRKRFIQYGMIGGVLFLVVLIIIIAVTVTRSGKAMAPTMAPTTSAPKLIPTSAPTLSITEQKQIACNFLELSSLSICQSTTYVTTSLNGTIPTEIGLLTQLTYLDLYSKQLTDTIPSTLGNLVQLTYLNLSNE
jgi:hypothetical protein